MGKVTRTSWVKGQCGNPNGRPKGTRNRATMLVQGMFGEHAKEVCDAVVKKALKGDMIAARIVVERIMPPLKDVPVEFHLPEKLDKAADVSEALTGVITQAAYVHVSLTICEAYFERGFLPAVRRLETMV